MLSDLTNATKLSPTARSTEGNSVQLNDYLLLSVMDANKTIMTVAHTKAPPSVSVDPTVTPLRLIDVWIYGGLAQCRKSDFAIIGEGAVGATASGAIIVPIIFMG